MYSSMPDITMTVNLLLLLLSIIVSSFEETKQNIIEKQLFNEVIEESKEEYEKNSVGAYSG